MVNLRPVFIDGDGSNEFRDTFYFGSSAPSPGCTDETACNYDATATLDDDSCSTRKPPISTVTATA